MVLDRMCVANEGKRASLHDISGEFLPISGHWSDRDMW